MRIAKRLILNTVILVLFTTFSTSLVLGGISYFLARDALEEQAKNQLIAVRDIKGHQIEEYFEGLRGQVASVANDSMVLQAADDLRQTFAAYPDEIKTRRARWSSAGLDEYYKDLSAAYQAKVGQEKNPDELRGAFYENDSPFASLQYAYVMGNTYPLGKKSVLEDAGVGVSYDVAHKKYHAFLRDLVDTFRIKDVLLVDPDSGDVFYTVQKNNDFALNMKTLGKIAPELEVAYAKANALRPVNQTVISDFGRYLPSVDDQRAFLASPIFSAAGKKVAILVFEIDIEQINRVMTNRTHWKEEGLGDTGETYLVGPDFRLRSMSRFFYQEPEHYVEQMRKLGLSESLIKEMSLKKTSIGIQPVLTEGAKDAQNNKTGFAIFNDYRDIPVLSAYAPLNIPDLDWVVMSEIDESEAFAPVYTLYKRLILAVLGVAGALSVIAFAVGKRLSVKISYPIQRFSKLILEIGHELDLTKRISVKTNDELGEMAGALNHLFANFQDTCQQTINSTKEMQSTVSLLRKLSVEQPGATERRPATSAGPTAQPAAVAREARSEKMESIAQASDNLEALSEKLNKLSNQFKVIEQEAERTSEW